MTRQNLDRSTRRIARKTRTLQVAAIGIALIGVAFARQPKPLSARGAEPTFAEDVAPILYTNCTTCHRPGGHRPVLADRLRQREDRTSTRCAIAVASEQMPPWHAEGPHGVFRNDRRLSDADRQTILRWIDAGAKPGDLNKLPPKPDVSGRVGRSARPTRPSPCRRSSRFRRPAPSNTSTSKSRRTSPKTSGSQAIEIMPGAREVVHHVLVYARAPQAPRTGRRRAVTPAPAPAGTAAQPARVDSRARAGQPARTAASRHAAPAAAPAGHAHWHRARPATTSWSSRRAPRSELRAGTILTFQMHYTAHGHEMKDRTEVGFQFAKEAPDEEIFASAFFNGAFKLPAGAKDVAVPAEIGAGQPIRIWGMMPHTHLRGTRWQYKLDKPDGTSEIILDVPHYDFNWQTYYMFAKPLEVPAGAKITSMAWYDNSASNKHNPDPTKDVKWGDQTWEEMQYTGFLYSIPRSATQEVSRAEM